MLINVDFQDGSGIQQMEESSLWKRTGVIEDDNEKASFVEYWYQWGTEHQRCVHRSAHIDLKRGLSLEGLTGVIGG